ncbi:MAG: hypothetical protein ABH820_02605 [Patescibacteria group bacterium]|nr:hypothetical protein [Patescibacteria group bacterium]
MTRPHEKLGLKQPLGRRLPKGLVVWNVLLAGFTLAFLVTYIVQVNRAATMSFGLRDVEKKVEVLNTEVMAMEDKVATLSSMQALSDRAVALGFVTVDNLEFVNPASKSYAMAH